MNTKGKKLHKPEFTFELSEEAALKNLLVLKKYDLDLRKALAAQRSTPLEYGSEFRPVKVLEPLFAMHPRWHHIKSILTQGSNWQMDELDEEKRLSDLDDALKRGNHKGAENKPDLLRELIVKDVDYGYAIPLPLDRISKIPGVCMAPVNIAPQNTIDEFGNIVSKDRLTHDQSFKWGSDTSINSRIKDEFLQALPFSHSLRRFINMTVAMRLKHPNRRIYCSKIDFKSAFRRMHLNWETALRSCAQLPHENLAIMFLRLTFGGKACPSEWCSLSEAICDLSNAIIQHPDWDPKKLFSDKSLEIPKLKTLPEEIDFAEAKQLVYNIEVQEKGSADIFIDDIFGITVDLPDSDNTLRLERGTLLAIETTARPLDPNEPIPRHTMAATNKFIAEALLEETKMILGWFINFRTLTISLPPNKHKAWTDSLQQIVYSRKTEEKELEQNIGRLVHVSQILPEVNHFLNRLRCLLRRAKKRRGPISVPENCVADCCILIKFLHRAKEGISLNLIADSLPERVYRSDSCPHGLGGYSDKGRAWRWFMTSIRNGCGG